MTEIPDEIELRYEVLLAFQSALLDMVTTNLRGVSVEWNANHIGGVCVYDGEISETEEEIVSDIEGEVISHFLHHTIDLKAKGGEASISLDHFALSAWVYRRAE